MKPHKKYKLKISQPNTKNKHIKSITLIKQLFSYILWGFLGYAIAVVHLVRDKPNVESIAGPQYNVVTVMILVLTIAVVVGVCDYFYSNHEPIPRKNGPQHTVMVVFRILFLAVTTLSFALMVLLTLLNTSDGVQRNVSIDLCVEAYAVVVIFYMALIFYVDSDINIKNRRIIARLTLWLIVAGVLINSIIGTIIYRVAYKEDRLIESNLEGVVISVDRYVMKKNTLPESLNDAILYGKNFNTNDSEIARQIEASKLITYAPIPQTEADNGVFNYQLCVQYKSEARKERYEINIFSKFGLIPKLRYNDTYLYSHDTGIECYDKSVVTAQTVTGEDFDLDSQKRRAPRLIESDTEEM